MNNDQYIQLEKTMVRYRDLIKVPVADCSEPFVILDKRKVPNGYKQSMSDMKSVMGTEIIVRKTVYGKLVQAQKYLKKKYPHLSVYVTYGYRSPEIQTRRFQQILTDITSVTFFPEPAFLYEEAHRFVAVPTVAGHPAGGAVDVTLINTRTSEFLDFGSTMYSYETKNCYVFAPVSGKAAKNRMILRECLMHAGFAPFDGEWWHFSFGDREWAYYYRRPEALYNQVPVGKLKIISYNEEEL